MVRRSRQTPMEEMAEIEVRFRRARHNGSAICVVDGTEEESPFTGKPRLREFWLPMKLLPEIDIDRLNPNQKLNLVIPQWLAEKVGLV